MSTIYIRNHVASIIDLFEEILEANNIYLPDPAREGDEDEACIFGTTYDRLEADILEVIESLCKKVRASPGAEIDTVSFNDFVDGTH